MYNRSCFKITCQISSSEPEARTPSQSPQCKSESWNKTFRALERTGDEGNGIHIYYRNVIHNPSGGNVNALWLMTMISLWKQKDLRNQPRTLQRANETPCNHGNDSEKQIGMCPTLSTCLSVLLPKAVLESMWFFPVLTFVLPFS